MMIPKFYKIHETQETKIEGLYSVLEHTFSKCTIGMIG